MTFTTSYIKASIHCFINSLIKEPKFNSESQKHAFGHVLNWFHTFIILTSYFPMIQLT